MRTIQTEVYKYAELSDDAKEKAREWYCTGMEYPWYAESQESIKAFCDQFGVKVVDYSYGPFSYNNYVKTDVESANFRGFKLKSFDREKFLTGYCLDNTLSYTFYDEFKRTGDALQAFKNAIDAAVSDIVSDAEYQYSDEAVEEAIIANDYEFLESGRPA